MRFSLRDFIWAIVCLGLVIGVTILSWQLNKERKAQCLLIRIYDLDSNTLKQTELKEIYHGSLNALRQKYRIPLPSNPDGRLFLDINVHQQGEKPSEEK